MKKKTSFLKIFPRCTHVYIICVCVCVPSNLTENAFEYSIFHTFEQQ